MNIFGGICALVMSLALVACGSGSGGESPPASGRPPTAVVAPTIAAGASSASTQSIIVSGGAGVTSVSAQYKPSNSPTWLTSGNLASGAGTYTYTGLAAATPYDYRLLDVASGALSNVLTQLLTASTPGAGGGGGGTFSLPYLQTFEGTNGGAVGSITVANGGNLESTYFGGYGSSYDTSMTRAGRSSSAKLSIKAGSDGDPAGADTGVGMGRFGINITLPSTLRCSEGDTLHTILAIRLPADFNAHTNAGILKFLRFYSDDGTSIYGHVDHHLALYGYIEGEGASKIGNDQVGWFWGNESDHSGESYIPGYGAGGAVRSSRTLPKGSWAIVELAQTWSANPALARRTTWINGQFAAQMKGTQRTYVNENGILSTLTGPAAPNLGAGRVINKMRLFTYWNGYSPKDQAVHLDAIGFYKVPAGASDAALPSVDEYGNRFIGLGTL